VIFEQEMRDGPARHNSGSCAIVKREEMGTLTQKEEQRGRGCDPTDSSNLKGQRRPGSCPRVGIWLKSQQSDVVQNILRFLEPLFFRKAKFIRSVVHLMPVTQS
jgi:hypothetical protein